MYFIVHAAFVRIKLMMMMMIKDIFCFSENAAHCDFLFLVLPV